MVELGEPGAATKSGAATKKDEGKVVLIRVLEVVTHKGKTTEKAPAGREQYINLDENVDPDHPYPEYGRVIRLKAQVSWDAGDMTRPLDGKDVHWYVVPGKDNKKGLTGNEKEAFDSPGSGKDKTSVKTDKDGWTPVVEFHLSQYGGDTFEIFATMDAGHKDGKSAGKYQVWRRFWYQVTEMKDGSGGKYDLPGAVTTAFELGYRTVFMNFTEVKPRNEAEHVGHLPTGADRKAEGTKYFTADNYVPFKCHIMTVDWSGATREEKTLEEEVRSDSWNSRGLELLWRHGAGKPWLVSAEFSDDGGKSWKAIPEAAVGFIANSTYPGYKQVTVDFSKSSATPSPKTPVRIKVKIAVAGGSIAGGWGGGSHRIYLCTGTLRDVVAAKDRNPMQRSDAVHEIGHALGLVNKPPAPAGAHSAWEDPAHPHHCKEPLDKCAMWFQSDAKRATTFHGEGAGTGCHDALRKQEYTRGVLKNQWKD